MNLSADDIDDIIVLKKSDIERLLKKALLSDALTHALLEEMDQEQLMMMTIPEFQQQMVQDSMRWFPEVYKNGLDITMLVLGLAGESGEVADELKKVVRGSRTLEEARDKIVVESIDLFHYLCLLWVALNVDPGAEYWAKRQFNEERFGPVEGEGITWHRDAEGNLVDKPVPGGATMQLIIPEDEEVL